MGDIFCFVPELIFGIVKDWFFVLGMNFLQFSESGVCCSTTLLVERGGKARQGPIRRFKIVSAHASGSDGLGSTPGRGHCLVFLDKTLYSHSASLHPGV